MNEIITDCLNIIVYGIGNTLVQAEEYINVRFNVIACSDSNVDKCQSEYAQRIPFIEPNQICGIEYDAILITSIYDNEIRDELVNQYGLPSEKVWTRKKWCHLAIGNIADKNSDRIVYIIGRQIRIRNGLMSYILNASQQLAEIDCKKYIPVMNMQTYPNQYMEPGEIGTVNTWEKFYEPLSNMSVDEAMEGKNKIWGYDDPNYLTNYKEDYDISKMHDAYKKYIRLKPEICKYVEDIYSSLLGNFKRPLGVLLRGTDMNRLKLKDHPIQPGMKEMAQLSRKYMDEWNCDVLYLCTEDKEIYEYFQTTFNDKLVSVNQRRFSNTGNKWLAEIDYTCKNERYQRALEYLTVIEIFAKCNNVLASLCCGTICSEIIHGPEYEHIKIIEKGFY